MFQGLQYVSLQKAEEACALLCSPSARREVPSGSFSFPFTRSVHYFLKLVRRILRLALAHLGIDSKSLGGSEGMRHPKDGPEILNWDSHPTFGARGQ